MDTALHPGTVVGGLTVKERLGRGGFGITYRARDNRTGRYYALKEYFPADYAHRTRAGRVEASADWDHAFSAGLEAFLHEANVLKDLPRQPGLVRVRGAFERSGTAYCLMEYIEGEPLDRLIAAYIRDGRVVPEALVITFIASLAPALAAVHEGGLIHRDIKPANVMIRREDSQPVLIDFGAARKLSAAAPGIAILTREYAPIEQFPFDWSSAGISLREGPWSDIFSLSVLLYRLVTRRLPPDAETRLRQLHFGNADPFLPSARAASQPYSRRLLDAIDYGCCLLPEERPADAAAFGRLVDGGRAADRVSLHRHSHFGAPDHVEDLDALGRTVGDGIRGGSLPRGDRADPQPGESIWQRLRWWLAISVALALSAAAIRYLGEPVGSLV